MAEKPTRKPRLRKSAPTVRQRAETARIEAEKPQKPKRSKKLLSKIKLPRNRITKPVIRVFSLIGKGLRWLVPQYFIDSWAELKLVTWPGRRETWRLTGAVFGFAVIFGAVIAVVDKILSTIFKDIILK